MITIVVDSTCYLTRREAERLGAVMAPMTYSIAGRSYYTENYEGENGEFAQLLARNPEKLHTSQVTMSTFMSVFEDVLAAGNQALCLTISSRLSGTYGNAVMAARELDSQNVTVVDSMTTAAGLYLMVREARRMIREGCDLRRVALRLKDLRARVRTAFSVDDIAPLRRSGRLGGVKMSISSILNIKPILRCYDGCVVAAGTARGRHEQLRALLREMCPSEDGSVVVQHFLAEDTARATMDMLRADGYAVTLRGIGPVLGIHLGKGTVGISWIVKE